VFGLNESITKIANGRLRVTCKAQHCGVVNRNNRLYLEEKTWARHCLPESTFVEAIRCRKVCGHIEHPKDGKADLKEAAIIVTDIELREGGEVWLTFETLSNELGRHVASLVEDKVTIGLSSRARGSVVKNTEGVDEVQEDFAPETFDIVAENSTPGAEVPGVHESTGLLCESLKSRTVEQIKEEEKAAICEAQLMGLKEQCLNESWDAEWESRLSEIKYQMSTLNESRKDLDMWASLVTEAVKTKSDLNKVKYSKPEQTLDEGLLGTATIVAAATMLLAWLSLKATKMWVKAKGKAFLKALKRDIPIEVLVKELRDYAKDLSHLKLKKGNKQTYNFGAKIAVQLASMSQKELYTLTGTALAVLSKPKFADIFFRILSQAAGETTLKTEAGKLSEKGFIDEERYRGFINKLADLLGKKGKGKTVPEVMESQEKKNESSERTTIGESKMKPSMRRLVEQAEEYALDAQVAADKSIAAAEVLSQEGAPVVAQSAAVCRRPS